MSSRALPIAAVLLAALASSCSHEPDEDEILVFAASSLADVAPELGRAFTAQTSLPVRFNFGSSMALARQVAAGAPADLLIAADLSVHPVIVAEMPYEGAYLHVASNELVLVTRSDALWPVEGLSAVSQLAVGDWRAGVPVGVGAAEWLLSDGSWAGLQGRLVPCVDARATLTAVLSGSVDAGIVYATDAASSDRIRIVGRAPARQVAARYMAFELLDEHAPAHDFAIFLLSPTAEVIFRRHGFVTVGRPGRRGRR